MTSITNPGYGRVQKEVLRFWNDTNEDYWDGKASQHLTSYKTAIESLGLQDKMMAEDYYYTWEFDAVEDEHWGILVSRKTGEKNV